ncbi:MAG: hypothetical protein C0407_01455 [Desulfobacca sp.]|nr:hypothetical protein [Desulfobacca sp.]
MSIKNKKIEGNRNLTLPYIIKIIIGLCILFSIMSLQHIFPKNEFVMKYFSGLYGLLWFILFWLLVFIIDFIIPRKTHKEKK